MGAPSLEEKRRQHKASQPPTSGAKVKIALNYNFTPTNLHE